MWLRGVGELGRDELATMPTVAAAGAAAVRRAAADAGVGVEELDAVLVYDSTVAPKVMQAPRIAELAGVRPQWASTVGNGGASPLTGIAYAHALLRTSAIRHAVVVHADLRASAPPAGGMVTAMAREVSDPEHEAPYGLVVPAVYALLAAPFLAEHGLHERHLDHVAATHAAYAALNPNAWGRPGLSPERLAEPIAGSLRRIDCCLITDFASAVVLSAEPAADRPGVALRAVAGRATHEQLVTTPLDDVLGGARAVADAVYGSAGIGPDDLDVAFLYDSFTTTVLLQLEAYSLHRGIGVARFIEDVGIGPAGLPVNTHGGMLAASTSGQLHVVEAVRQLRGEASARQIAGCHRALVTGIGGLFSVHAALLLERVEP